MKALIALTCLALPGAAFADSPDMSMGQENCATAPDLCGDEEVCFDGACIEQALVCADSESCPADSHCDLRGGTQDMPGRCLTDVQQPCSADAECSEGSICVGQRADRPVCAEGDARCATAAGLACLSVVRFCSAADDPACRADEVCVGTRCAAADLADAAAAVVIDPAREARVSAEPSCADAGAVEPGATPCPPAEETDGGCAVGAGGPAPMALGLALLALVGLRRRRVTDTDG